MKKVVEKVIKLRNPSFQFDENLQWDVFIQLIRSKVIDLIRGWRLILSFKNPSMLLLGKSVKFFNVKNISFGKWVKLDDFVFLSALGRGKILLGNNVSIGAFSRLIISTSFNNIGSHITIGHNVGIGEFAYLGGAGGLEIGNDCIIGQYFSCHPENHNFSDTDMLIRHQGVTRKGINIGENCWIGTKVTILDGVNIGRNTVIAAGSVVTKSFPANAVIAGVPARKLKTRSNLKQEAA